MDAPVTFSTPLPAFPPAVTGSPGVVSSKNKIAGITIAFDEALETASADLTGFYKVYQVTEVRRKTVLKSLKIRSASYDGSRTVTIALAKPLVKSRIEVVVQAGIVAANGAVSVQSYHSLPFK